MEFIIGIDEAGRGPLAGPVSVGMFKAPKNLKSKLIKILGGQIKDSKQLTPAERHTIYRTLSDLKKEKRVDFTVSHISNKVIDKIGISKTVQKGIDNNLKKIDKNIEIRLDGLLRAPKEFKNQKTIIKGDEKDVFIACASIVAKVERDKLMIKFSKKYPQYLFDIHKGYGTQKHRNLVKKLGVSPIHRKTFCRNLGF